MTELSATAGRAVEAALGAGAGAAEAYASRDSGREVRVHGGEVESLTAATQSGIGVRAWIGGRVGYAYGTDLSEAGVAAIAARAAEAAAVADEDEFARPPQPAPIEALPGLSDPSVAAWTTARVAELALTVERTALAADARVAGVEQVVYADSAERVAIASSTGVAGEYESSDCFAYLQALAEGDGGRETGLGFGLARGPDGLDPEAIGIEGAERATAMIGAAKPQLALLPGPPRPDRRRQLRRPDRRRPRRQRRAARPLALRRPARRGAGQRGAGPPRRRPRPRRLRLGTVRRRGGAAPPHRPDRGRPAARLPLRHLHGQPRGRRLDRQRLPPRLPLAALGLGLQPGRRPRRALLRGAARRRSGRASSSPTSPACTRASTRSPASSRSAPRAGRSAAASWPSRCASSRSPATWSRC